MKIHLLCLGKNKDSYIKTGIDEYLKRLRAYSETEIYYLPDVSPCGTNNPETIKQKEGRRIVKFLDDKKKRFSKPVFKICLDAAGNLYDSESFARLLAKKTDFFEVIFIIGGVYGLADETKERADLLLSLSRLTFTHQMSRIILLEQIYRGFTIIKGKKYHY